MGFARGASEYGYSPKGARSIGVPRALRWDTRRERASPIHTRHLLQGCFWVRMHRDAELWRELSWLDDAKLEFRAHHLICLAITPLDEGRDELQAELPDIECADAALAFQEPAV